MLNQVQIIGHLGREPETRSFPNGDQVCNFSIATTEKWKNSSNEQMEATEWHRVGTFGKLADICSQYLKKGSLVFVQGKLTTRKWTDKDGVEKYSTEIKADTMKMLGGKPDGERAPAGTSTPPAAKPRPEGGGEAAGLPSGGRFDDMDDDIPF